MSKYPDGAHVVFFTEVPTEPGKHSAESSAVALLLCKRTHDAPDDPGKWSLFGGAESNEDAGDPCRTALREVSEELCGVEREVKSLKHLCTIRIRRGDETPTITFFMCKLTAELDALRLRWNRDSRKVESAGFALFTEDEISRLPIRDQDRQAIEIFFPDGTARS